MKPSKNDALTAEARAAKMAGCSYGTYKSLMQQNDGYTREEQPTKRKRGSKRMFTDTQAFALWKDGKSDGQIAAALGVTRQAIQKWREVMELPSTYNGADCKNYRLIFTEIGVFATDEEDEV